MLWMWRCSYRVFLNILYKCGYLSPESENSTRSKLFVGVGEIYIYISDVRRLDRIKLFLLFVIFTVLSFHPSLSSK